MYAMINYGFTNTDWENMQLRVYLRTYALDQMVQAVSSSAGLRTIKRVEQTLQDLGVCSLILKPFFFPPENFHALCGINCIFKVLTVDFLSSI